MKKIKLSDKAKEMHDKGHAYKTAMDSVSRIIVAEDGTIHAEEREKHLLNLAVKHNEAMRKFWMQVETELGDVFVEGSHVYNYATNEVSITSSNLKKGIKHLKEHAVNIKKFDIAEKLREIYIEICREEEKEG